ARRRDPAVLLVDVLNALAETLQPRARVVGGAVVDDDHLDPIAPGLRERALDGPLDEMAVVVRGDDRRDHASGRLSLRNRSTRPTTSLLLSVAQVSIDVFRIWNGCSNFGKRDGSVWVWRTSGSGCT